MFHFYTPWKQKTSGFLMFSGVIEVEHWLKMGKCSWTIFHLGFAWIIYGKSVIRTFLGTFFGRPYLSNGTKIHLDVALSFTFYHKVIFFGGRNSIDDQVRSWFVYLNATWIVLLESNTSLFLCLSGFVKHNYILFIASCMTCFSLQYSCQKKKKKKKKKSWTSFKRIQYNLSVNKRSMVSRYLVQNIFPKLSSPHMTFSPMALSKVHPLLPK